jgi:DNA-binding response OmpR family regulator
VAKKAVMENPDQINPQILVVDDDNITQTLVALQLKRAGYTYFSAYSAKEALAWLAQNSPDAIIMDVMMPEMDGFALCRHIRQDKDHVNVLILMVSALGLLKEDNSFGYAAGADDVITKPYTELELRASLKRLLKKNDAPEAPTQKVLIAEDDKNLRRVFMKALRHRNIQVELASDGYEALKKMETFIPDVLVLDMNMPGLSGFDTIQRVKRIENLSGVKIAVVTGYRLDENHVVSQLADVVLQKPVSTRDLVDWVQRLT